MSAVGVRQGTGPFADAVASERSTRWNSVARAIITRRAVDGAFQVRYNTDLTVGDYISRQAWWDASPPACPFHRQGSCQLRPHGSYARKVPAGVRVRRFRCSQSGQTVSLLPDCLAARLPGTLAEVERVVREAVRPGFPRGGWKRLHPSSYLGTAGGRRWVRRRVERVRLCLALLTTLLPDRYGRLEPTVETFGTALGTTAVLVTLRSVAAAELALLPAPVGFSRRMAVVKPAPQRVQHATGRSPPAPPA